MQENSIGISIEELSYETKEWLRECEQWDEDMKIMEETKLKRLNDRLNDEKKYLKKNDPTKYNLFYGSK
jgi:hypothetical protein